MYKEIRRKRETFQKKEKEMEEVKKINRKRGVSAERERQKDMQQKHVRKEMKEKGDRCVRKGEKNGSFHEVIRAK